MQEVNFTVKENVLIAPGVYKMVLSGDSSDITAPGQFINISLPDKFLRRPISVCDKSANGLTIIYKTVGAGTLEMSRADKGAKFNVLTGLGNGFNTEKSGDIPLLIGGGVGIPPLYLLCKKLTDEGKKVKVILGFNTASEVFYEKEFKALGALVTVTTVDGSYGEKGFVSDVMQDINYTYFYTCGPLPMFKAIEKKATGSGQYSFEQRMGCGFGACMGCSVKTKNGFKRVCKEGPVFEREEIIW